MSWGSSFKYGLCVIGLSIWTKVERIELWVRNMSKNFYFFGVFFWSNNFNYVAKDLSILHLKPSSSDRPNYFSTFTPLGHNPPRHSQPITSNQLLGWRVFDI